MIQLRMIRGLSRLRPIFYSVQDIAHTSGVTQLGIRSLISTTGSMSLVSPNASRPVSKTDCLNKQVAWLKSVQNCRSYSSATTAPSERLDSTPETKLALIFDSVKPSMLIRTSMPITLFPCVTLSLNSLSVLFMDDLAQNMDASNLVLHGATLVAYLTCVLVYFAMRKYISKIYAVVDSRTNSMIGYKFLTYNYFVWRPGKVLEAGLDEVEPGNHSAEDEQWSFAVKGSSTYFLLNAAPENLVDRELVKAMAIGGPYYVRHVNVVRLAELQRELKAEPKGFAASYGSKKKKR